MKHLMTNNVRSYLLDNVTDFPPLRSLTVGDWQLVNTKDGIEEDDNRPLTLTACSLSGHNGVWMMILDKENKSYADILRYSVKIVHAANKWRKDRTFKTIPNQTARTIKNNKENEDDVDENDSVDDLWLQKKASYKEHQQHQKLPYLAPASAAHIKIGCDRMTREENREQQATADSFRCYPIQRFVRYQYRQRNRRH